MAADLKVRTTSVDLKVRTTSVDVKVRTTNVDLKVRATSVGPKGGTTSGQGLVVRRAPTCFVIQSNWRCRRSSRW